MSPTKLSSKKGDTRQKHLDFDAGSKNPNDAKDFMLLEFETLRELWQSMAVSGESRLNYYLTMVSGAVIIVGSSYQFFDRFIASTLAGVVSMGVVLVGLVTYLRVLERTIAMTRYVRGMNRIRRYFVERSPAVSQYITLPTVDDKPGFTSMSLRKVGIGSVGITQVIAVLNSMIAAAGSFLVTATAFHIDYIFAIICAVAALVLTYVIHSRLHSIRVSMAEKEFQPHFPSA